MRDIIASELLKMAKDISFDQSIVFVRNEDTNDHSLNKVWTEVGNYLDKVRKSEEIETFTARSDNGRAMEISIGVKEHEDKKAIIKATIEHAEKLGRRFDLKVLT